MNKKTYTGINVQYPISQMIFSGKKTIETRKYPIPPNYLNQEMLLVETPGKVGRFKSRVIAIIKFTKCFQYHTKNEFYSEISKHCVSKDSEWAWDNGEKWGWNVEVIKQLDEYVPLNKRIGIKYTKNISLS